jgi:hypothetical protein
MTLPEIEKATKILVSVKQLDSEIIAIEKMARTLSENIYDVDFSLSFTPIQINKKVEVLDSEGFLKKDLPDSAEAVRYSFVSVFETAMNNMKESIVNSTKKQSISEKVNESLALKLLAVVLRDKQSKRDNLIVELKLIGAII